MFPHLLTVVLLALYGHEIWRTIQRFGQRRAGITGTVVSSPKAHIVMSIVLTFAGIGIWQAGWGPVYGGLGMSVISVAYLWFSVRFFRQARQEEERENG